MVVARDPPVNGWWRQPELLAPSSLPCPALSPPLPSLRRCRPIPTEQPDTFALGPLSFPISQSDLLFSSSTFNHPNSQFFLFVLPARPAPAILSVSLPARFAAGQVATPSPAYIAASASSTSQEGAALHIHQSSIHRHPLAVLHSSTCPAAPKHLKCCCTHPPPPATKQRPPRTAHKHIRV